MPHEHGKTTTPRRPVIVTRHPAAEEFIREEIARSEVEDLGPPRMRCLPSVTEEQVRGRRVYGNLPLHLAALAESVVGIEFRGAPPRGREYGIEEMREAGAYLCRYVIRECRQSPIR